MDNADCADGILVKWWWFEQSNTKHEKKLMMKKKSARSYVVSGLGDDIEYTLEVYIYELSWSSNRVLHLDVEEWSEDLLTPALLCHKEPARASKAPY